METQTQSSERPSFHTSAPAATREGGCFPMNTRTPLTMQGFPKEKFFCCSFNYTIRDFQFYFLSFFDTLTEFLKHLSAELPISCQASQQNMKKIYDWPHKKEAILKNCPAVLRRWVSNGRLAELWRVLVTSPQLFPNFRRTLIQKSIFFF